VKDATVELSAATLDDILDELSKRPIDFVVLLTERTNSLGRSGICSNLEEDAILDALKAAVTWVTTNGCGAE
jgi:hypothetical protein